MPMPSAPWARSPASPRSQPSSPQRSCCCWAGSVSGTAAGYRIPPRSSLSGPAPTTLIWRRRLAQARDEPSAQQVRTPLQAPAIDRVTAEAVVRAGRPGAVAAQHPTVGLAAGPRSARATRRPRTSATRRRPGRALAADQLRGSAGAGPGRIRRRWAGWCTSSGCLTPTIPTCWPALPTSVHVRRPLRTVSSWRPRVGATANAARSGATRCRPSWWRSFGQPPRGDGVHAQFPIREEEKLNLAVAVSWADRVERKDPAYLAEMRRWQQDADVHIRGRPRHRDTARHHRPSATHRPTAA